MNRQSLHAYTARRPELLGASAGSYVLRGVYRLGPLLLLCMFVACSSAPRRTEESPSVTALMWMPESNRLDQDIAREFTRNTGIAVHIVPGSESASERLTQAVTLLKDASSGIDVFEVDTIWPEVVADYTVDLKPALRDELSDELPQVVENATVRNRLVAAPFYVDYAMLYYRTDLLKKYGFSQPPRTWDELEAQSSRIQKGERASGRTDFWGYVWQGAAYEGLTCNALEWQDSQGGGNLLEQDGTVTVNNPKTIAAFSRAARWVGTISPPGVVAYLEEDSRNVWQSGRAAFMRNWSYAYPLAKKSVEVGNRISMAPMPAGAAGRAVVLGGWYLGVSRHSRHRSEAIAFVKYMVSKEVQTERAIRGAFLPTIGSVYRDPSVLRTDPFLGLILDVSRSVVRRPTLLAGGEYDRISGAYAHGVHMILTGKATAPAMAANVQAELVRLMSSTNRAPRLPGTAY